MIKYLLLVVAVGGAAYALTRPKPVSEVSTQADTGMTVYQVTWSDRYTEFVHADGTPVTPTAWSRGGRP